MSEFDTIATLSTPPGEGGIGVIRISGSKAVEIAERIFRKKKGSLAGALGFTVHYGHVVSFPDGVVIDEGLALVFRQPHSYTAEDVVEVHCHGGFLVVQRVLENILGAGARLAEPGEFTKRAFLNGRLDLVQAEAIMDIIRAKTDKAQDVALAQLEGGLSAKIGAMRQEIFQLIAEIEASIDFSEHEVPDVDEHYMIELIQQWQDLIEETLANAQKGKIFRDGLKTVILGRPNVGKSSLLNALVREERVIVSQIPGTTRDVIEEYINVKGIPVKIMDTAGIRDTSDEIEQIGVKRSRGVAEEADLLIAVFDGSDSLTEDDITVLNILRDSGVSSIKIINKIDKTQGTIVSEMQELGIDENDIVYISAVEKKGIDSLEEKIFELAIGTEPDKEALVSNLRHRDLLKKAEEQLAAALQTSIAGFPQDLVVIDIRGAFSTLGEITGETASEDVLDEIFARFCIGK